MDILTIARSAAYATMVLGFCFFFHELGHYLAYRLVGVVPTTFSLGIGPSILSYTDGHGTTWQLAPIPIGAYVEAPPVSIGRMAEIFTALAGPLANFVTGFALLAGLLVHEGCTYVSQNGQNYVCVQSVAELAGHAQVPRVGVQYDAVVISNAKDKADMVYGHAQCGLYDACAISGKFFLKQASGLKKLVTNLVTSGVKSATKEVSGPIGVIRIAAAAHCISYALFLASQIAFALGLFNLLPIPPLDGSRIVCAAVGLDLEDSMLVNIMFALGFALLAVLMVLIVWQDITRILWH